MALATSTTATASNATGVATTGTLGTTVAGQLIVICISDDSATAVAVTSVTDTFGNTWTKVPIAAGTTSVLLNASSTQMWYAVLAAGKAGASHTVTVNWNTAATGRVTVAAHYANGFTGVPTLDQYLGATGSSTSASPGTTSTTTAANEIVFIGAGHASTTSAFSLGSGYTNLATQNVANAAVGLESKVVAATGAQTGVMTIAASRAWGAIIATFKDVPAVTTTNVTKAAKYTVKTTPTAPTKSLKYTTKNPVSITKSLKYTIIKAISTTKSLKYAIKVSNVAITKSARYAVKMFYSPTKSLRYAVKPVISITKGLIYVISSTRTVSLTKSNKYTILNVAKYIYASESMTSNPMTGTLVGGATGIGWQPGGYLRLTVATSFNNAAFEYTGTLPSNFIMSVDMAMGSTSAADSCWFYWGNTATPSQEDNTTGSYAIERNIFSNIIAIRFNGTILAQVSYTKDTNFDTLKVYVVGQTFFVYYNGTQVLQYTDTTPRTLPGTKYGWAARCGGSATTQDIKNASVTTGQFQQRLILAAKYTVLKTSPITKALKYAIKKQLAITKATKYTVKVNSAITKNLKYTVKRSLSVTKGLIYEVKTSAATTKSLKYTIKKSLAITRSLKYTTRKPLALTKSLAYRVRAAIPITKSLKYTVKKSLATTKAVKYTLKKPLAITKSLKYTVKVAASQAFSYNLKYTLRTSKSKTKSLIYDVKTNRAMTKSLRYTVARPAVAITKSVKYTIVKAALLTKLLTYDVNKSRAITKALAYRVALSQPITRSLTYRIRTREHPGDPIILTTTDRFIQMPTKDGISLDVKSTPVAAFDNENTSAIML